MRLSSHKVGSSSQYHLSLPGQEGSPGTSCGSAWPGQLLSQAARLVYIGNCPHNRGWSIRYFYKNFHDSTNVKVLKVRIVHWTIFFNYFKHMPSSLWSVCVRVLNVLLWLGDCVRVNLQTWPTASHECGANFCLKQMITSFNPSGSEYWLLTVSLNIVLRFYEINYR